MSMSLSLFQEPPLNASAVPVAYPPLSRPDVSNCNGYYSYPTPPLLSDCRAAFRYLPSGTVPTLWYTKPAAGEERKLLPLTVHHGTCEIIFHTSGQSANSADHYWIVPDDIRAMASWVLARCCFLRKGGMVTKGLKSTIDAITADPSVKIFPDPPLPPSSSFYSLHIWNKLQSAEEDWNPGNNEADVGDAIDNIISAAAREAWIVAPDSPETVELERRQEYLWEGLGRLGQHAEDHWWDGPRRPEFSSFNATRLGLMKNGTGRAVNLTRGCSSNDCDGDSTVA